MNNHTTGPWKVVHASGFDQIEAEGSQIASVYARNGVATMHANAQLIAAAPDLLNAIRDAITAYDFERDIPWGTIREAFTKATGESN